MRENSSNHNQKRVGKGCQIRDLEAMPCVSYPALLFSERFNANMYFLCMIKYTKMKFTILTIFKHTAQ